MIPTSSFIIPPSPFLPARLSKQMKQRLESVPEHRRTIAEERITRLMQRSFQEGEKLERIEALVALVLDALELDEYWTVCQHVHEAEKVDVFHFATAELHHSSFLLLTSPVGTQARRRLEFLDSLDRLATTAATTEKQMHTALQNNLWVFGPECSLMASNRQLRTIIEDYIGPDATDLPDLFLAGNVLKRHLLIEFKKPTLTVGRDAESQAKKVADTLTGKLGMPLEILIIGGEVDAKLVAGYTGKETKFASYRAVIASAKTQLEWLIAELTTKD